MCLYHRKGSPGLGAYERLFLGGDERRVKRLSALLRLAEYLDRSRSQAVTSLKLEMDGKRMRLRARTRSQAEGRVEVWEAARNSDLFEEAFGCKLEIE